MYGREEMNPARRKAIHILVALALVLSLGIAAVPKAGVLWAHPGTIQVDVNDPGCVTGSGQPDPYSVVYCSIQDAIDDASPGDVINVAAGTYYESITLRDGVQVLGAGADVTTIDGSTARGGEPAYHVVVGADNAVLDGFTVTGGNANGGVIDNFGGGMLNWDNSSPTVTNCIFSGNSADAGGGMHNGNSSPTVTNCIFSGNSARMCGGINNSYSSPTVTNCIFSGNSATYYGGGIYNYGSSPTVTNCIFSGNSATAHGGGMRNYDSSPTVTNCIFEDNSASEGGGMYNSNNSSPTVTNCIFDGNSANVYGGGMYNNYSSPTVTNCIFDGNSANVYGGGMYNGYNCSPTVTNCIFSGNSATSCGGGMYNGYNCSPAVTKCTFSDNSATTYWGGGMCNWVSSSPTVTHCIFSGNWAAQGGGGMSNYDNCSPTVTNCIFSDNSATTYSGGGMYNLNWSSPTVTNCIFERNSATSLGGGMYNYDNCSPAITNNIIVRNTALNGGGLYADAAIPIDYNDVWNNPGANYGGSCSPGPHDISQDPMFVNPAAQDFHSKPGSPCIDAGTNAGAPTEDIEGNPRPTDGDGDGTATTDMGAYEYMPPRPPPHFRYLHAEDGLIDLAYPVGTQWHELYPLFCREYHLGSWEDNGDGILSPCDQIDMYEKPDGEVRWYHVDEVTITLFVTPVEIDNNWNHDTIPPPQGNKVPQQPMYIELEGGYDPAVLTAPNSTQWHEIYPVFCREYHLLDWKDNAPEQGLDFCDYILLENKCSGEVTEWHVEEVAIDIVVTIKPPPVGGEAYPVSKMSLVAPWIAVGVVLAGGAIWLAVKRRKARS
jgi:hypothetical protein